MEPMEIDPVTTASTGGNREEGGPVALIMIGAPGSGKSTFCDHIAQVSSRPWVRICQDTIGNGKPGTKAQCITTAAIALKEGKSILIDRCNIDREQRADFLKLGGPRVQKHALVLDLPAKLCISRSVKRTNHDGNLQGGKAAAVVNQMLKKKVVPKLSEGFSRITFCYSEKDVEAATKMYSALGPGDTLPAGCFGQKNPEAKIQLGIMKFLKKVEPPGKDGPVESNSQISTFNKTTTEKDSDLGRLGNDSATLRNIHEDRKDLANSEKATLSGAIAIDSVPTLAFPSLSTADFHFNHEKASDIIIEKVGEFMIKLGNARLVLVDLYHRSKILSLVKVKAAQKNIDPKKFFTFVGDITQLYSGGGLRCNVIANAANWRLKPGGGGVNAAIHSAAGPELDRATKEIATSLEPGKALIVPLPSASPLSVKEGVTHVIHVLGPNMNPQRPNCLNNDYAKGCKILREAYSSLFESFATILSTQDGSTKESSNSQNRLGRKCFDSDQKAKREAVDEREMNKKSKSLLNEIRFSVSHTVDQKVHLETEIPEKSDAFPGETGHVVKHSEDRKDKRDSRTEEGSKKVWGSWAQALHQIAMHPEQHTKEVMQILDDVVVLSDLYPKASKHLLVLARVEGLDRLADVCKEHLPLLNKMHEVGLKWVEQFLNEDQSLVFRLGYHSAPSMRQLHLHVISQDFDSKHLKNKKHWNSFTTPFFRDSVDVLEEVSNQGKAIIKDEESYQSMELRCHRCRSAHPNIPRLKTHISRCQAAFPDFLLKNARLVFRPGKVAGCVKSS